jgi:3-dehydroquinate synthase
MTTIRVPLGDRSYDVVVEDGALARAGTLLDRHLRERPARVAVIGDEHVLSLHGATLQASLEGFPSVTIALPRGETAKDLSVYGRMLDELARARLDRTSLVIALGGGAASDVAGFAAATYLRGIRWTGFPSTLLAQVDAAIGGKTGVNLSAGKNLAGAFHQPSLVAIDPGLLATLEARERDAGFGEVLKYGLLASAPAILERLESSAPLDRAALTELIGLCVAIKADVVARDERERSLRAHLNLGHTFAHALERAQDYRGLLHGEAVGLGLIAACHLSAAMLGCDATLTERVRRVLARFHLPLQASFDPESVLAHMGADKKRAGAELRLILLERPGVPRIVSAPDRALLLQALAQISRESGSAL